MTTHITVRGFHVDVYGHVNNARYLEFLEEARWAAFGEHGELDWWRSRGYAFVIANIDINFRAPAGMGDSLAVTVGLPRLGERSGVVHHDVIRDDGTMIADADVTFVVFDQAGGATVPLTGELRQRLEQLAARLSS